MSSNLLVSIHGVNIYLTTVNTNFNIYLEQKKETNKLKVAKKK